MWKARFGSRNSNRRIHVRRYVPFAKPTWAWCFTLVSMRATQKFLEKYTHKQKHTLEQLQRKLYSIIIFGYNWYRYSYLNDCEDVIKNPFNREREFNTKSTKMLLWIIGVKYAIHNCLCLKMLGDVWGIHQPPPPSSLFARDRNKYFDKKGLR